MPPSLRLSPLVLAAAVTATLFLGVPAAQAGPSGSWQILSPPSQSGGAATYDSQRQRFVVFGGDGTSLVHVCAAAGPPAEWTSLTVAGTPPAARENASIAYDAAGDRLIVFGGADYAGHAHADLWQLTLSGTPTWSPIASGGSTPSPRANFGACFDQDRRLLVVFGGVDSTGGLADGDVHQIDLGQPSPAWSTWSVDANGPDARQGVTLCDDAASDGMIAFGGDDGGGAMADAHTMSYGSHAWTALATSGDTPAPAANALVAFDADDTLLFVWGGSGSDDNVRTLSPATGLWTIRPNDNWQNGPASHAHPLGIWVPGGQQLLMLDGDGSNQMFQFFYTSPSNTYWQVWLEPGDPGEPRYGGALVYDPADDVAVLYGCDNTFDTQSSNWWGYSLAAPRGWDDGFFTGLGGTQPPARWNPVSVWDTKRDRLLTFGGTAAGYVLLNDVGELDVSGSFSPGVPWYTWGVLSPAGTPPSPRAQSAGIYDPAGDRVLIFGGLDAGGYPRADLWQLTLAGTPTWSRLVLTGGPSGRCAHSAIYDAPKKRMLIFGGQDSLGGAMDNDVWALNLPALTWTHLAPTGTPPPGRVQHTAVFDSRRERMLVLGGTVAAGNETDTWELSLAGSTPAWTKLAPTTLPGYLPYKRYEHQAVYDSTNDRMLVFGGLSPPISIFGGPWAQKDLWSLQFDFSGGTSAVAPSGLPTEFAAGSPWPNPAHGAVRMSFALPVAARVEAGVFDVTGRRVRTLAAGVRAAGRYELAWDGAGVDGRRAEPGLYFVRLTTTAGVATRKVVLAP